MKTFYLFMILTLPCLMVIPVDIPASEESESVQNLIQVVPNNYSATGGTASFTGPLANLQRTYQLLIHQNQIAALAGKNLTAISFRLPQSAVSSWPTTGVTYNNYDIYLSGSVDPVNRSLTFANNIVGPQTQVRSGQLSISAGAYTFGSNPNQFGAEITFNTPYFYGGGNLLVEIRQNGFAGTARSVDAISMSTPGYGTDVSACWTGSYTGTSGSQGNFSIIRFSTAKEPIEPVLNLFQIDYEMNGYLEYESDWGLVRLTTAGYPTLKYFNLSVQTGGIQTMWQVQNAILFNQAPFGEIQSATFAFDIGDKGFPVSNVLIGYSITDNPIFSPPPITESAQVYDYFYKIDDGFPFFNPNSIGLKVPVATPFQNTGSVKDNSSHGVQGMPNQDCGVKECAPVGFSNSLKFLRKQHNLTFDSAYASLDSMKKATGFTGGTMTADNYYQNKADYLKKNNIPITTRKVSKDSIYSLQKELDNKQDVEMFVWWYNIDTVSGDTSTGSHIVNVTNVKKLGGGKYQITAQDDRKQGTAGGTESETVTYDSATNKFTSGTYTAYDQGVYHYVVECPNTLTTAQVSPPNNAPAVPPGSPLVWTTVPGATSYWLEVAIDPLFEFPVINITNVPGSSYVPPLQPLTQYFWRVRVNDSAGPGSFVSVFSFTTSSFAVLNLSALIQGFYNPAADQMIPDSMRVYLRNFFTPYSIVDSAKALLDANGNAQFSFANAVDGVPYYLDLHHRNSVQTFSSAGVIFSSGSASYDFTNSQAQAFGSNMILVDVLPVKFAIYGGDVNQDETVDATDVSTIDNDASNFVSGYVVTDLTGDSFVDGSDFAIADNNAANFVSAIRP
ncbi:MAG: hypothetical protein IPL67_08900 [Ignavibacteria bacterium]|nr:hypothetical protein [Ignavibacteria bacterium]